MKIKDIEKIKNNMGEVEFYKYFYFSTKDDSFIEDYIEQFRESEKIIQLIYKLLKDSKEYKVDLYEGCIQLENKNTRDSYKITIEF